MEVFKELVDKLASLPILARNEDEELLHRYKGIPYIKVFPIKALEAMYTFEVRSDDLFLVTYPKASTTWTQEIISMILSGADETELGKTHLFFRFPFLEMNWASHYSQCDQVPSVYTFLDKVSSPRTIKTHLSGDHIPPQVYTKKPKIIYVARNPKDVAVSFFHMHRNFNIMPFYSEWDKFIADFSKANVHCGSWYDHTLFWWQKRNEPNVLFLKYEDMKRDLGAAVVQIANFLGCQLSDDAVEKTVNHCTFLNMKKNPSANPDSLDFFAGDISDNKSVPGELEGKNKTEKPVDENASFIRKGIVGDWKNHFTVAQNEAFDTEYHARMKDTDLTFDFRMKIL